MSSRRKQEPVGGEKHHFVPQGYLKGFAVAGKLYVLNKEHSTVRQYSPGGVGYIKDFYIVDTIYEKGSREVENNLQKIESTCIPIIRRLARKKSLNKSQRADLAIYISIQYSRTPLAREKSDKIATIVATNEMKQNLAEAYNSDEKYGEFTDEFKREHPNVEPPSKDKIKELVLKRGSLASISLDRGTHVKFMFESAPEIAQGLLKYRWKVIRSPKDSSFVTSDSPIAIEPTRPLLPHQDLAILLPGAKRYFALNSKCCLLIDNAPFEWEIIHETTSKGQVRHINKILHKQARKYVMGNNKRSLCSLKGNSMPKKNPKGNF